MRYQILYSKRGWPFTVWMDDEAAAQKMAARLRKAGYSVELLAHAAEGAHKIEIRPPF